ncbi:MAG TPA: hypothetical protein PLX03_09135, partial [Candidatus Hydrogenedentes bacterium]|nr:hypothetical protein [Candidatus Hydrogenedentota bacterium]
PGGPAPAGPGAQQNVETRSQPIPNGMIIKGYAETDTALTQFISELKRIYRQIGANVYLSVQDVIYSEASVQAQPWNVLYNAPLAGAGGGGAGQQQGAGGAGIFSFEVTVKFRRSPQPPSQQEQPKPGGAGA